SYVTDTVGAFLAMAESENTAGMVCNAGNGMGITIGELAATLINMIKPGAELLCEDERVRPEHSEVMALLADASRLSELTGWAP
ncbi:MAG: hypothetical protein P5680_27055, partial [Limnospira sp. PMC 737.11]|nr:hypothetical protein [Limnospira sp. PMC 737.11]